jgi:hypothetical protein
MDMDEKRIIVERERKKLEYKYGFVVDDLPYISNYKEEI